MINVLTYFISLRFIATRFRECFGFAVLYNRNYETVNVLIALYVCIFR